jgi:ABC-type transport system involved in cytochrome c biogenesis permease subunit
MPLLWLRVAIFLYAVGLLHALLLLLKKEWLTHVAVPAVGLGMVFHFVSLTELALSENYLNLLTIRHAESMMALLIGCVFMFLFVRYRTSSPGIFMFPLMFLLTFASEMAQRPPATNSPMVRSWLIPVHVSLLLIGYAALFLSFLSSLL